MSSSTLRTAASRAKANKVSFWGKWGVSNPKQGEEFLKQAYNRGYGQPVLTGRYIGYDETPTMLTFLARRWRYDWLKHVAMRVDAERTPLVVLRRQIYMARLEYWMRRWYSRKAVDRAAKVEWAYIKGRLEQPMTWTGHDLLHGLFYLVNVFGFFAIGESLCRVGINGYPVATPEWSPARPQFAPGFYHVYDPFESYPFDNQPNMITKQFQRTSWWHNSAEQYWAPHRILAGYPHG